MKLLSASLPCTQGFTHGPRNKVVAVEVSPLHAGVHPEAKSAAPSTKSLFPARGGSSLRKLK